MLLPLSAPRTEGCVSEHGRSIPLADIDGAGIVDVEFATDHSSYLLIGLVGDRKNHILIDGHTPFGLPFFIGDFDAIKKLNPGRK